MNRRDIQYALSSVDASMDRAELLPLLLVLQTLRELLLRCWQKESSRLELQDELLGMLASLPDMCGRPESYPGLPILLIRIMLLLCKIRIERAQHPRLQCDMLAEKIRLLHCCWQVMVPLFTAYDEEIRREAELLYQNTLNIMNDAFRQCLELYRVFIAAAAARLRKKRLSEIEQWHKLLCMDEVNEAVLRSQTDQEWLEKLFSSAEMEDAGLFITAKDRHIQPEITGMSVAERQKVTMGCDVCCDD